MSFDLYDMVALLREIPEDGLRKGAVGTVVYVYAPDVFEVEFVNSLGGTDALLTLKSSDIRAADELNRLRAKPDGAAARERFGNDFAGYPGTKAKG